MNFAPYQDNEPSAEQQTAPDREHQSAPYSDHEQGETLPSPAEFERNIGTNNQGFGNGVGADERNVDVFSTTLNMRLDWEASLAYLLLPPAGGALLLVLEHKSDYVRFHAWQSSLLFTFLFLIHLIFSWSKVISFMLLAVDLIMIAFLTLHAYRDSETLDRCELPFFGKFASNFVDSE